MHHRAAEACCVVSSVCRVRGEPEAHLAGDLQGPSVMHNSCTCIWDKLVPCLLKLASLS